MAIRLHQVSLSMRRQMFPLVVFKINRSTLIFAHFALSDACNNQRLYKLFHFVLLTNYVSRLQAIFSRDKSGQSRAGKIGPSCPSRVTNQNTGFASSCQLAEPAI